MTATRLELEILHQPGKKVKTFVRKFWGLILTFVEVTEEKLVGEPSCPPASPLPPIGLNDRCSFFIFYETKMKNDRCN